MLLGGVINCRKMSDEIWGGEGGAELKLLLGGIFLYVLVINMGFIRLALGLTYYQQVAK